MMPIPGRSDPSEKQDQPLGLWPGAQGLEIRPIALAVSSFVFFFDVPSYIFYRISWGKLALSKEFVASHLVFASADEEMVFQVV